MQAEENILLKEQRFPSYIHNTSQQHLTLPSLKHYFNNKQQHMSTALDIRVNSSPICNGWNCRALIRTNFSSKNVNVLVSNVDLKETSKSKRICANDLPHLRRI